MRTMESEAVIRDSGPAADAAYDETIRIQDGRLCVALVRADYLVAELNGVHCVITKSALLCLGGCDRLEILYEKRLRVRALSFTPRFINRGLDYATLCSPSYQELQAAFGYPPLDPFFSRSSVYNGILPVEEELDGLLDSYFDVMQRQLRDHPDRNWSCRTRSLLFSVFSAAGQLYRQFGPPRLSGFPDRGNDAVYPDASGPAHVDGGSVCAFSCEQVDIVPPLQGFRGAYGLSVYSGFAAPAVPFRSGVYRAVHR